MTVFPSDARKRHGKPGDKARVIAPQLPPELRMALHSQFASVQHKGIRDFTAALRELANRYRDEGDQLPARAICLVVADLIEQGWKLTLAKDHFSFEAPGLRAFGGDDLSAIKDRIRASLRIARDRQLEEPSVRSFIRRMERRTLREQGRTCVLDLIDSGVELAADLGAAMQLPEADRERALGGIIDPVVELCDMNARCGHTGLRLLDVWRYFRHTWSLEYRPIPGRQMPILIRNAARPNAPVIGIAMLASPALRMRSRDHWVGWRMEALEAKLSSGEWKAQSIAETLDRHISVAIGEIRADDLASAEERERPTERVILRLAQKAAGAAEARLAELRERYEAAEESGAAPIKRSDPSADWRAASDDMLYVRKRAEGLSKLLEARLTFNEARLLADPEIALPDLLASKRGRRAIEIALTEIRKAALASRVADVSVCGAVAPYNELLGGKLVTLLITAHEVRDFYRERYGRQVSVIASQLAGYAITRSAELQALTTTSLYGVGSSQYNRCKLRKAEHPELGTDIVWEELGVTEGYGTAHLGSDTVAALRELSAQTHGARRVNNIFGEGSSPRLRQIREGLDALGVNSDDILHHATPRIVYACELGEGAREHLMGLDSGPPPDTPRVRDIAAAWRRRWLIKRLLRPETYAQLAEAGPCSVRAQLWADEYGQFSLELDDPLGGAG